MNGMQVFWLFLVAMTGSLVALLRKGGRWNPMPSTDNLSEVLLDPPEALKQPVEASKPPTPTIPAYEWETPQKAKHSVRVICDEEGLTLEQKNTLCATIGGESGWKTDVINRNYAFKKDGTKYVASTDWGICQWNDYYHGKEISPDEAMNNPEKAVRLMCQYWKRGQRDLWIAYKNGSYKKYL